MSDTYDEYLFTFLDKAEEIADFVSWDIPGTIKTRDGITSVLNNAIDTEPLLYAENPWNPRDDDVRSAAIIVGFSQERGIWPYKAIVISFQGKDVHSAELTTDRARGLAALLNTYADFLDGLGQ